MNNDKAYDELITLNEVEQILKEYFIQKAAAEFRLWKKEGKALPL